jgi:hypothetical protein
MKRSSRRPRSPGADLIFMASHGRRGISGLLLGSETQKVLTHSKIPGAGLSVNSPGSARGMFNSALEHHLRRASLARRRGAGTAPSGRANAAATRPPDFKLLRAIVFLSR